MLMGWRFAVSLPKVGRGAGSAALVPPLPAATPPLAPLELQAALGYPTAGLEAASKYAVRDSGELVVESAKYFAGMLRHGLMPRQLPFRT